MEVSMTKLRQQASLNETEMRAFYASVGISKHITEAAIKARRVALVDQEKQRWRLQNKKRKAVV
jgi:hypothetical protein